MVNDLNSFLNSWILQNQLRIKFENQIAADYGKKKNILGPCILFISSIFNKDKVTNKQHKQILNHSLRVKNSFLNTAN